VLTSICVGFLVVRKKKKKTGSVGPELTFPLLQLWRRCDIVLAAVKANGRSCSSWIEEFISAAKQCHSSLSLFSADLLFWCLDEKSARPELCNPDKFWEGPGPITRNLKNVNNFTMLDNLVGRAANEEWNAGVQIPVPRGQVAVMAQKENRGLTMGGNVTHL
jgi:hypothetical protein